MGFFCIYMMFNILICTQCEISPYTCIPRISPSSASLIHMVIFPLSESHFHLRVFPWWPLESTCSRYLHHHSTHRTRHLDPPPRRLSIQGIFRPRIHHHYLTCLNRSPSWTISFDTNCCEIKENKHMKNLHQPTDHE